MAPTDRDDDAPALPGAIDGAGSAVPALPDDDERALPPSPRGLNLPATGRESDQPQLETERETELETQSPSSSDDDQPADASLELPRFVQPDNAIGSGDDSGARDIPALASADTSSGPATQSSKASRGSRTTREHAEWAPKPLVSGDPLLTGPTPIVGRSDPRPPAHEPEPTARPAPIRPDPPPQSAPPPEPRPPQPRPSGPPPPPNQRPVAPPGAVGGVGGIGGVAIPGVQHDVSGRTARRAARGAQMTGQQATSTMTRPVDQSGPVPTLRPTTVAPVPRLAGRRPRVRRVTRVVRHVDPWSVFKVAAVFSLVAYTIALVAGVLLWNVAYSTGTVDNIERGMESTGWSVFELQGGEIFHNAWIGGLFIAVGMTGLAVLVATLFNLITDLVGGIRFTVLEEEVIERTSSPMRRFTTKDSRRPGQ